jgi:hypothetical protein
VTTGLILLVAVFALCAYVCVPRGDFPKLGTRIRWGIFFFLVFLAIAAARIWAH